MKNTLVKLKGTQYVIYNKETDQIMEYHCDLGPIIFDMSIELIEKYYKSIVNEKKIVSCTKLPTHKQVELLNYLKNEI